MTRDPVLHHEVLRGGAAWSRRLSAHQVLRIVDTSGGGAVAALFYNADEPLERYNMADTLKAQFTAFLTQGRVLYSDMGRVMCSIVEDTAGWHDTLSGAGDAASSRAKFGEGEYQKLRNDFIEIRATIFWSSYRSTGSASAMSSPT